MRRSRITSTAISLVLACTLLTPTVRADDAASSPPIISGWARTLPSIGKNGMVATQEAKATSIGLEVLRRGGNAVDAAVAVGFALAVTLPRAGNLGGGGFMLLYLNKTGRTVAIDYRETSPAGLKRDAFLDEAGRFVPERSQSSGLGVGVPGTVAGLLHAYSQYGSGKLSLDELISPAEKMAREGVLVEDDLADSLPAGSRRLGRFESSRKIFFIDYRRVKEAGDLLVQTDLANTLRKIAMFGVKGFYEGEIATRIVASVAEAGGVMTTDDLARYRAIERNPLKGSFRGYDVHVMPPPSSGGVHLLQLLNILEPFKLSEMGHNSARSIHLMTEAMKLAYADRAEYLGDPDFHVNPVRALTSKRYADDLRATISLDRARPSQEIKFGQISNYESDQTTHFSIVDRDGNAVSNTYTLNFSYGLGKIVEGAGFLLNNELDDFAARDNAPNAYGVLGGAANSPGPYKRPLSSMTPTIVTRDGEVELVTGSPGGARIITIVLQNVLNVLEHGMNIAEAAAAPRVHHQLHPDELRVENGISIDTLDLLQKFGHRVQPQPSIGSVQTVQKRSGWLFGASDQRQRGGAARGF